jgi:hypothetical protein
MSINLTVSTIAIDRRKIGKQVVCRLQGIRCEAKITENQLSIPSLLTLIYLSLLLMINNRVISSNWYMSLHLVRFPMSPIPIYQFKFDEWNEGMDHQQDIEGEVTLECEGNKHGIRMIDNRGVKLFN